MVWLQARQFHYQSGMYIRKLEALLWSLVSSPQVNFQPFSLWHLQKRLKSRWIAFRSLKPSALSFKVHSLFSDSKKHRSETEWMHKMFDPETWRLQRLASQRLAIRSIRSIWYFSWQCRGMQRCFFLSTGSANASLSCGKETEQSWDLEIAFGLGLVDTRS